MFFFSSYTCVLWELLFVLIPFSYALRYSRFWPVVTTALHLLLLASTKKSQPVRRGITVAHLKQGNPKEVEKEKKEMAPVVMDSWTDLDRIQEKKSEPELYDSIAHPHSTTGHLMPQMPFSRDLCVN